MYTKKDLFFLEKALEQAKIADSCDEIPIGAVLVKEDFVISSSFNQTRSRNFKLAHAEIIVIENAKDIYGKGFYDNSVLYVTLEPCLMCISAVSLCGISKIFYGLSCEKFGSIDFFFNENYKNKNYKMPICVKIIEFESQIKLLMKDFFYKKRT
jgi:tRNA(adenine34) deaminase